MDPILGSGDANRSQPSSPRYMADREDKNPNENSNRESGEAIGEARDHEEATNCENNTPQAIVDHETKLKDRISQCRKIIESLKLELNEEKAKLEKESSSQNTPYSSQTIETISPGVPSRGHPLFNPVSTSSDIFGDFSLNTDMYSACVDSKLNCDENLKEYEKQLDKYQTTLNMAQIEKKNAIRKQNLAKAYKLKLLELENQCNIELLRVKQSLQCLEPLQMIASKWKIGADEGSYDVDKFELMPCYPEIGSVSGVDIEVVKDEPVKPDVIDVKDVATSDK
ncbi:hypothetical protein NE865_09874 [Phthorimaea operculella]|nr:hypothetical protein NE865_09874 [Phthorimaea operculella]